MTEQSMSDEQIRAAASASMAGGGNIREKVRDLTLQALQSRKLDLGSIRDVMKSMSEGITAGAEHRKDDLRRTLSDAFTGMDQAMSKAAQASSLALQELSAKGREFSDTELRQGLERMRQMEGDFMDAVKQVSQAAGGTVKTEWQDLVTHAQRAGTDTGKVISQTFRDFSMQMGATMSDRATAGIDMARQFGERFAAMTSGILQGMSEALKPKDKP